MPVTSCVVTGTALRDAIRSLLAIKKAHFPSSSPLCRQGIKPIRPADGLFCSGIVRQLYGQTTLAERKDRQDMRALSVTMRPGKWEMPLP